MFDLRYHVASLVAVFFALVIGIVVGVGISGRGLIRESERIGLENRIDELEREAQQQQLQLDELEAAADYERETYSAVISDRLSDRRVALVFVGSVDGAVRTNVEQAVDDAGGTVSRMRALRVPVDAIELSNAIAPVPGAPGELPEVGRSLAQELLDGGETPLWNAVGGLLVEEREGETRQPVDAVVVARSAEAQRGATARFLGGFYGGLASAGRPAVAVETVTGDRGEMRVFATYGFSTVNNVDTPTGRVTLAILLTGDESGQFGIDAEDGYLPSVDPVAPTG